MKLPAPCRLISAAALSLAAISSSNRSTAQTGSAEDTRKAQELQ
jgi:hypothetical protein